MARAVVILTLVFPLFLNGQIANYVNNGGFEDLKDCNTGINDNKLKYWSSIDTTKFLYYIQNICLGNVPTYGTTYQNPRSGNGFVVGTLLCAGCYTTTNRTYFRNKLKTNLIANSAYCIKLFVNVKNGSPYGIDAIDVYFGDSSLDTIKYCDVKITYLIPQIQNPVNNIITDTLNWISITGTFVATGNEKYMVIGNFRTDANTNKTFITGSMTNTWSDICIDDVSCIPLDLPAYASPGPDIWAIPGNTVYLGRPQDVGIDEACMWYKLPNTTTAIDTAAGITITVAATTETYMVKQDICGVIKYDTVVVHASALGFVNSSEVGNGFGIYPNPASNQITIKSALPSESLHILISDLEGRVLYDERLVTSNNLSNLGVDLVNGVYLFSIQNSNKETVTKKLVINN